MSRRQFIQSLTVTGAAISSHSWGKPLSDIASATTSLPNKELSGNTFDLHVGYQQVNFSGKPRIAITVNQSLPAPLLRMQEGDTVTIHVHNHLQQDTSIHWHGLLLPYQMDGVPGISFDGIKPNQTFTYQFKLQQSGTYWYHAHSTFQEQTGLLGGIIISPHPQKNQDKRHQADREHVIILSDWTDLDPAYLLSKLKKHSHFDNQHKPTLMQLMQDIKQQGHSQAVQLHQMWNRMRMSPTDFADLSAGTFTYLINGNAPAQNWTGLFNTGENVRLRIINGSAHTFFDLRIPNLKMTVIAADGQDVEPVTVDEIRLGAAETYDVLVQPVEAVYTIFAQNMDRTGFACGTLATTIGLKADIPRLDAVEWLNMADMGHGMMQTMHDNMSHAEPQHGHQASGSIRHASSEFNNPNVDMRIDQPRTNLDDPGVNLRTSVKLRKVLTYADLHTIGRALDLRAPTREIELHLTGNMERYTWGFDGQRFDEAKPIHFKPNERVRITLVNDTMMTHPMHLHGMWSEIVNEQGEFQCRKHTVNVQPAQKISFDITAIEGRWAWHCHLLYHMEAGMFREVIVA